MGGALHRLPERARPRAPVTTATSSPDLVSIDAIRAAAAVLRGITIRTPLVPFGPPEDERFLKAESLQPIGAFKLRGAYVAIASLSDDERLRGVITYSSGNHAQGVARAARLLGVSAVVVMPSDAPRIKRDRVAEDGAEIVTVGTASDERQARAEAIAADRGLAIIPPYDDDRIIAGQGTVGLEIAEDLPAVTTVLVPIGGGGLAAGVATAIKALRPGPGSSASSPSWPRMPASRSSAARSSAGPPLTSRAPSPTGRGPRRSVGARSPTWWPISTASSPSPRRRSPPVSAWPQSARASSPSHPAHSWSPHWPFDHVRRGWRITPDRPSVSSAAGMLIRPTTGPISKRRCRTERPPAPARDVPQGGPHGFGSRRVRRRHDDPTAPRRVPRCASSRTGSPGWR